MNQFEREEQALYDAYSRGELTQKQLNQELRELQREWNDAIRTEAEEAAEQAYNDVMGRW